MVDLFKGSYVQLKANSDSVLDPLSISHTEFIVNSNTSNTFTSANSDFASLTISNDYKYQFVLKLDLLSVRNSGKLNLRNADLILTGDSNNICDFVSSSGSLTVATGSSILNGNSYSSTTCPDSSMTTKASTINFTQYCNGAGTCN